MKTYKYWTMILALGAAMAAPLYGCSSDDVDTNKPGKDKDAGTDDDGDDGDGGEGGEGGSGGEGGNGDGGNGGDGGSGGSGGGPTGDEACLEMGEQQCVQCCANLYPNGAKVFDDALVECLCSDPGVCETECAGSICGGAQLNQECANCANSANAQQTCGQHVGAACQPVPECVSFYDNCYKYCG